MGDSDDEYDRRRVRDKFRGERNEYEQRRPRGGDYRDRRDWVDRSRGGREGNWSGGGGGGRDPGWDRKRGAQYYGRSRRDSEGGEGQISPPSKRRRDWESSYDRGGSSGGIMQSPGMWSGGRGPIMPQHQNSDPMNKGLSEMGGGEIKSSQAPKMMTFKSFLASQEDNIDEIESVRRYQEYKTEFKRTQLSDFFVLHKEEEWFKNKYHPMDAKNQAKERRQAVKERLRIFLDLLEAGYMDDVTLEGDKNTTVKLLDAVAIRLEGGTLEDLALLENGKPRSEDNKVILSNEAIPKEELKKVDKEEQDKIDEQSLSPSSVPLPDAPPPQQENKKEESKKKKKRKRSKEPNYEVGNESESESSGFESESEPAPPGEDTVNADADIVADGTDDKDPIEQKLDENSVTSEVKEDASTKLTEEEEEETPDTGSLEANDETGLNKEEQPQMKMEENKDSEDSSSGDDRNAELEKRKGLGAYLEMMRSENAEQKKDDSNKEDESVKEMGDEKEKSGKRDWEKKKGTGLGAFVARMRGDGNEDSESDSDSESDDDEDEDGKRTVKNDTKDKVRQNIETVDEKKHDRSSTEEFKGTELGTRQLHKTLSLFMKSVPPSISKADISAICKRYPGFLRVALADPNPDKNFCRRGWVTFENNVNIKDVCWNLSNIRIKDCELNPVVNRDLSKRIRPITGITLCKQVVRFDIKFSAKLVKFLDEKISLYSKEADQEEKDENSMDIEEGNTEAEEHDDSKVEDGEERKENEEEEMNHPEVIKIEAKPKVAEPPLPDENPVLAMLPQSVTELTEGDGEAPNDGKEIALDFAHDESVMKALDKLLLYLRIVHSVDYYNGSDYPCEDEMPNRSGIIHVRGEVPDRATQAEVSEWKTNVEQKLGHYLEQKEEKLADDDIQKLGKKNVNEETENFIAANTIELAKDKWLCPLSGKKFRAKEFVKKHIHNKHCDKLDAVRLEVDFFNNYLGDPKRPQFPDSNPTKSSSGTPSSQHSHPQQPMAPQMGWNPRGPAMMYGGPRVPFTPPAYGNQFPAGPEMYGRSGVTYPPKVPRGAVMPPRDTRKVVQYRDLDAPDDVDFF